MTPANQQASVPAYAERLAWLEAQDAETPADQHGRRLANRAWAALWPKVLAIAIVLAVWQLIHVSGWKKLIFPGPSGTLSDLRGQLQTGLLWHAIGITSERAVIGFALAAVIGGRTCAPVSRIAPPQAAARSRGRRTAVHHREPAVPRGAAVARPGPGGNGGRHLDHHRDPDLGHHRRHGVRPGGRGHPAPLGPDRPRLSCARPKPRAADPG